MDLNLLNYHEPLSEYPWKGEILKLLEWSKSKSSTTKAFCFDLIMSLSYIDSTSGLERYIETCQSLKEPYNCHLGFINLCAPCYEISDHWTYQKAAKPESGALGKLSSEVMIYFVKHISRNITKAKAIGGTEYIDAILELSDGTIILAEVKSAPLLTYPLVISYNNKLGNHEKISLTTSQFKECETALYLHNKAVIPIGKPSNELWPFKGAVDYIINSNNTSIVDGVIRTWLDAKNVYISKERTDPLYYLTNACGSPPKIAKERDGWPNNESISDSKTSAGMDRTDDIKKGIYQVLKIGTEFQYENNIKTALISNLPAFRHGEEYVTPFIDMLWGKEKDIEGDVDKFINIKKLRRAFDYIITIEDPITRGINL